MKKLNALIFTLLLLFMAGCGGSGGDADGNGGFPTSKIAVELVSSTNDSIAKRLDAVFTFAAEKMDKDIKIELNNFSLSLEGCEIRGSYDITPDMMEFTHKGETKTLHVGNLRYSCPNGELTENNLLNIAYDKYVLKSDGSKRRGPVREGTSHKAVSPDQNFTYGYELVAVPSSFNIVKEGDFQAVDLYLNDTADGKPVKGMTIQAKAFNQKNGTLDRYEAVTDDNGRVTFVYTAPAKLPTKPLTMTFEVAKATPLLSTKVKVTFDRSVDTDGMKLVTVPKNFNISAPLDEKVIDVFLNDNKNGKPVEGVSIMAKAFNQVNGTLDKYEGVTDANGKVSFNYKAPSQLPGDKLEITFMVVNGKPALTAKTTITFGEEIDTGNMLFRAAPDKIDIAEGGSVPRAIDLYLSDDETKQPLSGVWILAHVFDQNKGTLDSYRVETDDIGHAAFFYNPPAELPKTPLTITFEVENGKPALSEKVRINFDTATVDTTSLELVAVPERVDVTNPQDSYGIDLFVNDLDSRQPMKDVDVIAYVFNENNGTLDRYTATTDSNGKAHFIYTPPKVLDGSIVPITFAVANGEPKLEKTVTVALGSSEEGDIVYQIMPQEELTVDSSDTGYEIRVALEKRLPNGSKRPVVGETILADFVQPANGSLAKYEVQTGEDGLAIFNYRSPSTIFGGSSFDIVFHRKLDENVTGSTKVSFVNNQEDRSVEHLYIVPETVQVTDADAEQEIKVYTTDAKNIGISSTVIVEQLVNGDGNDYGEMETTVVSTDSSGIGVLKYKAPSAISNQPDRTVKVVVDGSDIESDLTFKYISPSEGVVPYELNASLSSTLRVDSEGTISIKIHEVGNPDNIIPDERVKNVDVSVEDFSNMLNLPAAQDGMNYNYDNAGAQSVTLETRTIAGVALVEITATVFDGDKDITLKTTLPVTILSGPVATLSMFYTGTVSASDTPDGLFRDLFTIHAVDKYGNIANEGVQIHPSLICGGNVGHVRDAISIHELNGTIQTLDTGVTRFKDTTSRPFADTETTERLVVLPWVNGSSNQYIGDWTIAKVNNNRSVNLDEDYYGDYKDELKYVVGDESRLLNDKIVTAHVEADENYPDYKTDKNGVVKVVVKYDPLLVGHTYTIAANSYDEGTRAGVAIIDYFRGVGYNYSFSPSNSIEKDGNRHSVVITVHILPVGSGTLDRVNLNPYSFFFFDENGNPDSSCDLNLTESNLTLDRGHAKLVVDTVDENKSTCRIQWGGDPSTGSNGGLVAEYR